MSQVNIKFIKTHPDAVLPTKGHDDDNCFDLYAVEDTTIPPCRTTCGEFGTSTWGKQDKVLIGSAVVPVGLKVADITDGYGFVIKGRSGLGFKHGLVPHFGEIDCGYRGDLGTKLYNFTDTAYHIKKGERVAQFKIEKVYDTTLEFVDEATESNRGDGRLGSTGK